MPEPKVPKPNRTACGYARRFRKVTPMMSECLVQPISELETYFRGCPVHCWSRRYCKIGAIARALHARQEADRKGGE